MSDTCVMCDENPGRSLGEEWPEDWPTCKDCADQMQRDSVALPSDRGGMLLYSEAEEHPFRDGRWTLDALSILFASTPDDKTTDGTPRVLARGKSGKLGVRALIEAIYVSKVPPLMPPDDWVLVREFVLPGLLEIATKTKSNDTVLREALAVVEEILGEGHWVLVVATPRQLAWDLHVFAQTPKGEDEED